MFEAIGWVGAAMLIWAQYALSTDKLAKGQVYFLLNIFGGVFLGLSAWEVKNFPTVATNIVWTIVAINGIRRLYRKP